MSVSAAARASGLLSIGLATGCTVTEVAVVTPQELARVANDEAGRGDATVTTRSGERVEVGRRFSARIVPTEQSGRAPFVLGQPFDVVIDQRALRYPIRFRSDPDWSIPVTDIAYVEIRRRDWSGGSIVGGVVGVVVSLVLVAGLFDSAYSPCRPTGNFGGERYVNRSGVCLTFLLVGLPATVAAGGAGGAYIGRGPAIRRVE